MLTTFQLMLILSGPIADFAGIPFDFSIALPLAGCVTAEARVVRKVHMVGVGFGYAQMAR